MVFLASMMDLGCVAVVSLVSMTQLVMSSRGTMMILISSMLLVMSAAVMRALVRLMAVLMRSVLAIFNSQAGDGGHGQEQDKLKSHDI